MSALAEVRAALAWAFTQLRLLVVLCLANLLVTLTVTAPLGLLLLGVFSHSEAGRDAPFLSADVVGALLTRFMQSGPLLMGSVLLALLLAFALQIFLSGGTAARATFREPVYLSVFASECVKYLGRNCRLAGWALLGAIVPGALVGVSLWRYGAAQEQALSEGAGQGWLILAVLLAVVFFILWRSSLDAARIWMVRNDLRATRRAAWWGLRDVLRTPSVLASAASLWVLGALVTFALTVIHAHLPVKATGGAVLALAFSQLMVMTRSAFSIASTAAIARLLPTAESKERNEAQPDAATLAPLGAEEAG